MVEWMDIRFSIFIPVYNDARWIPGALDSILQQTHQDWEVVIGDNQSTDDVPAVLAGYPDERIRYHRWPSHVGPGDNFNRTIQLCRFEWLQMLSADDRLAPACLERMAERIAQSEQDDGGRLALVVSSCQRIDEDGQPADWQYYRSWRINQIPDGRLNASDWLRITANPGALPWNIGSVALSREVLGEMGGFFRAEIGLSADVEMTLRAAAYGDVAYIREPLLLYTVREDSMRHTDFFRSQARHGRATTMGAALLSGLSVHEDRRVVTRQERSHVLATVARTHVVRALQHRSIPGGGGRRGALRDTVLAFRQSPRTVLTPSQLGRLLFALGGPRMVIRRTKEFRDRRRPAFF
jgi:glycosyltransferase involved in cell wall biosynthesis